MSDATRIRHVQAPTLEELVVDLAEQRVRAIGVDVGADHERLRRREFALRLGVADGGIPPAVSGEDPVVRWQGATWRIEPTTDDPDRVVEETSCLLFTSEHGTFIEPLLEEYQRARVYEMRALEIEDPRADTEWRAHAQDFRELTNGAIDVRTAEVLVLYEAGVSAGVIADALNMSETDVGDRLSLVRKNLSSHVLA